MQARKVGPEVLTEVAKKKKEALSIGTLSALSSCSIQETAVYAMCGRAMSPLDTAAVLSSPDPMTIQDRL